MRSIEAAMNTRQKRLCTSKDQLNKDVQSVIGTTDKPESSSFTSEVDVSKNVEDMDVDRDGKAKIKFNDSKNDKMIIF